MAPTVRCTLLIGRLSDAGTPFSMRFPHVRNDLVIERCLQAMVLRLRAPPAHVARHRRIVDHGRKVNPLGLPVLDVRPLHQAIHPPDHLVHRAESQLRHHAPQIFRDEEKEIDHVFRLALELLAQFRVLRGHAHRAGVQVALAHHDAAHRNQRRGREAELLRAQQRGDGHVPPGLQLAVHLQAHAAAQVVHHQHLLRLGKPQLPRHARMPDRADRRRARPAVVSADQDHIRMSLGHARGHRSHAHFRDQLHRNPRPRIRALQVVNELRQVLDRINVVVRRRRNQAARRGSSGAPAR